ncbi:transcriptional regulator [Chimaeribacter californicus]|uniref:Transcriptional regulator n=1 Tax=Chimaeribacter californicus TaxID=2060067 RepID=A0A2N5E2A2_9GAMM|nr:MarR family transcriptional regulator [Chimaeribacter californicus]PLR34711.1 transcriptional regulator [Chimaeribacter californicus]
MKNHLGNIPFHLMRQLFQEHTALWQKSLPELTKQQYSVLCAVAEKPAIEQMALMGDALMTKATLAELLVRMEQKGLVHRAPGETDRRRRLITLTPKGATVLEQARPVADAVDSVFLARLNTPQQQELVTLLQTLLAEKR